LGGHCEREVSTECVNPSGESVQVDLDGFPSSQEPSNGRFPGRLASTFVYSPRHALKRLLDLTSKGFEFVSFSAQPSREIREVKSVAHFVQGIV
jgi:hypothetical protein